MTTTSSIVTIKPTPPMATMAHAHPGTFNLMPVAGGCCDGSDEPGLKTCIQSHFFLKRSHTKFALEYILGNLSFRPQ